MIIGGDNFFSIYLNLVPLMKVHFWCWFILPYGGLQSWYKIFDIDRTIALTYGFAYTVFLPTSSCHKTIMILLGRYVKDSQHFDVQTFRRFCRPRWSNHFTCTIETYQLINIYADVSIVLLNRSMSQLVIGNFTP